MTLREHLEAIRDDWLFEDCERLNAPHPIWTHAVAALAILDTAEKVHPALARHGGERIVPDPKPSA